MPTPNLQFGLAACAAALRESAAASLRRGRFALALAILAGAALSFGGNADAEPPAESAITFVGKNLFATADGTFHEWRVVSSSVTSAEFVSGDVEVEIDLASVDTDNERRDEHLRTADFFDVSKYPTANVRVHSAVAQDADTEGRATYGASFDIDLHGVQKTLYGQFTVLSTEPLRVEGRLEINRVEFGVGDPASGWNPMSIGDEIPISFTLLLP